MIAAGVEARLVCVDLKKLPKSFAGRRFDDALLADLPAGVDPCGENGEFHSFVAAGPMLSRPVPFAPGEIVERDGYAYADLPSMSLGRRPLLAFWNAGILTRLVLSSNTVISGGVPEKPSSLQRDTTWS